MGIGSLSMIVPMYNAEIAPPEVRGALVGLQQLSITLGIMISFWIDYGTVRLGKCIASVVALIVSTEFHRWHRQHSKGRSLASSTLLTTLSSRLIGCRYDLYAIQP